MVELTNASRTVKRRSKTGNTLADVRAWVVDAVTVSTDASYCTALVDICTAIGLHDSYKRLVA